MLDAEEARAALVAIRDDHWKIAASRRVGKLKRRHRPLAEVMLKEEPAYNDPGARRRFSRGLDEAGTKIDGLSDGERITLMSALHPDLGVVIARWWVDAQRQPYTTGWGRRAFRAPNAPALTRGVRCHGLRQLLVHVGPYQRDAEWLAAWAPHLGTELGGYGTGFAAQLGGPLLAAAIDAGGPAGERVLSTLIEIGNGEHPVGTMGRHVIVGLLRSARPDAWAYVERMLLAAQRQEGLRQSILEAADEAHPGAFDRMLEVVVEHNLLRFAAAVRAASVWLGFSADVEQIPQVAERLDQLRRMRTDVPARAAALAGGDAWETYLALYALGLDDVVPAVAAADDVLARPEADARAVAVRFVASTDLNVATSRLLAMLDDEDLAVAALAHALLGYGFLADPTADAFERLERLAHRLPERQRTAGPVGIEQAPVTLSRASVVGTMVTVLGDRPLSALLPWVPAMDADTRQRFATAAGERKRLTPDVREALVAMVGDRSSRVRESAVRAMERLGFDRGEAAALEELLDRRAGDLRRGVITLLARQPVAEAVRSAQRLWADGSEAQRDAACELLGAVPGHPSEAVTAARSFADDDPSDRQQELLDEVAGVRAVSGADDPGLGLFDTTKRAPVPKPVAPRRTTTFASDAGLQLVSQLDDLVGSLGDTTVTVFTWQGTREVLLADAHFLPTPFGVHSVPGQAGDDEGSGLILGEVFRRWYAERPPPCRQDDGLDALRALTSLSATGMHDHYVRYLRGRNEWWVRLLGRIAGNVGELRYAPVVHHVLSWLLVDHASTAVVDECLDALEATLAAVPASVVAATPRAADQRWRYEDEWRAVMNGHPWVSVLAGLHLTRPELFDAGRVGRWFRLARWLDEPRPGARRHPVDRRLLLAAHAVGAATDHDVLDALLSESGGMLTDFTRRRRLRLEEQHPRVVMLADRVRDRVLRFERSRGELPTAASALALRLGSVSGATLAVELLAKLGRASLVRGWIGGNLGREAVYSHLLRISFPGPDDSPDVFRTAVQAAGVGDKRLTELAMFAPQWATLVEEALAWPGAADAVWWFHAHTKDEQWSVDHEVRETWAALSAERTSLSAEDLVAGAVDVDWFRRCRAALGERRWRTLHASAKLASGGSGHRRAQLFAEALIGDLDEAALVERLKQKRHQDSARALGLVPLPDAPVERDAATLRRYGVLREFERGSSKFGSQRQASERTAVRIGVENLARTAGFADPQRFVWAMEAAEAGPLAEGPMVVTEGDVTVTLSITAEGVPDLAVRRAGRSLKAVPASLRKDPAIAELRDRKTALTRQATRVRASLEAAMVRQDPFTAEDLAGLDCHPVVAPMLELVVFVDHAGRTLRRTGGRLVDVDGSVAGVEGGMRLAHPVDLQAGGTWISWQEQLFVDERRQPFKQVFRELYTLTANERASGPGSSRYEGHQIQPRQAMALFGRRGWLTDRENGDVSRVFHEHDIVARVDFLNGFLTPAEVELPSVGQVYFTRRGEHLAQPLDAVPAVVFSETMRDLDLVVSVAHAGGVDPEATASTVEMRAALVRETSRLLKLGNVRPVDSHVVIEGALGEYSVHLGSGVVHRRPGGALCIIPVDSQRRGRIFLPFADDDPKTAEVVAKVLLLARDNQIRDPTILEQLRS